jgi:cell division transport system ATP-binding protein
MIRFFNVSKRYPGGQQALDDVSFHVERGERVFLTGSSGAGKTTLLKLIFRQDAPSEGQILVNGRNVSSIPRKKVPYLRRSIGVVFQDFRLIQRKTVFENVTFVPRVLGVDLKQRRRIAYAALRRVGLAHRIHAFPPQLSGGEQQRVAIARALINQPELLIADEPTGNLDPELSREILRLFMAIHRRGTTVLIATHDRDIIHRVGGRLLTLDGGRLASDLHLPPGDLAALEPLPEDDLGADDEAEEFDLDNPGAAPERTRTATAEKAPANDAAVQPAEPSGEHSSAAGSDSAGLEETVAAPPPGLAQ